MQIKEMQKVYRAQPFQPFIIHMADGRSVRVDHPEFMALSPVGRAVVVFEEDGGFEILDVLLITGLEVKNGKSASKRKGK